MMKYDHETRRARRRLAGIALSACAALAGCGTVSDPDEGGGGVAGYPMVGDTPAIEFEDGSVYLLERLDEWKAVREQFPLPDEGPPPELEEPEEPRAAALDLPPATLPERVDLRPAAEPGVVFHRFDTIENQGGRGTCVAFATVAAIEAAYQRERGLVLDLSEQYANHIQKMTALPDAVRDTSERETQLGAWGGSGVGYQLGWLFRLRFGLPEESAHAGLAYIGSGNYGSTNQDGDVPRIDWRRGENQRQVDLWNLSSTPTAYAIPEARTLTNLPRAGLESAVYGVRRVRAVDLDLAAIKAELAAGREVAFGVGLTRPAPESGASAFRDDMWIPLSDADGGQAWGGHAMLIVGYDDARGAFLVKNSWGRDGDGRGRPAAADADADGYIEMSYDWMPYIYEAYSVLETRDPDTWTNLQPWIGHWQAELDGPLGRADLAVYHLPGAFPDSALDGQRDRRLGTLYADDATHRVNGWVFGRERLRAHFGTDARYDRSAGSHEIDAYRAGDSMAGWVIRGAAPDEPAPFYAGLAPLPEMVAAQPAAASESADDYLGTWRLGGGELRLTERIGVVVTGTYRAPGDEEVDAVLRVSADDPCRFSLELDLAEGARIHDGGLFCDTDSPARRALMAGTWEDTTGTRGFYASRAGDAGIEILSPTDGGSDSRGARVELSAEASGATEIVWTSNIDGEIGRGADVYLFDLSYGTHEITATATHASGEVSTDSVALTITNDAPDVSIVAPEAGDGPFCTGEAITFRAVATDFNEWPSRILEGDAIQWVSSSLGMLGTGEEVVVTFDTPATERVTVAATDSQGDFDEESIDLTIEDCPDNPPTVAITSPAEDSGTGDNAYVYDGYDDALGMWYTDVPVVGSASDPEDGALTGAALQWTTDRTELQPASLGSGSSRTIRLYSDVCTGTWHEVTLRATDSDGNVRSAVRRLFIWTLC